MINDLNRFWSAFTDLLSVNVDASDMFGIAEGPQTFSSINAPDFYTKISGAGYNVVLVDVDRGDTAHMTLQNGCLNQHVEMTRVSPCISRRMSRLKRRASLPDFHMVVH